MRVVALLLVGIVLGIVLTFGSVEVSGGWYTYTTLSRSDCDIFPMPDWQVVPNQPNPCHFRRPRW